MVTSVRQIEQTAQRWADLSGFSSIADIPQAKRDLATTCVATHLGVAESSVAAALGIHWLETNGRQGMDLSGGNITQTSSNAPRRVVMNATMAMIQNQVSAKPAKRPAAADSGVLKTGPAIMQGLDNGGAATVKHSRPMSLVADIARRNVAFDSKISGVAVGSYGTIDPTKLDPSDPVLDMPMYRGMGSSDPAVHALRLTGKLIPQGMSSDYEGFKHYDHKSPIDSYEWTLDPYVALKGAGGHGYLVKTTLREMMAQGKVELGRKVGDTEGGIFIASAIEPNVRPLAHQNNTYELGPAVAFTKSENSEKLAKFLASRVPREGGWDEFIDSGHKAAVFLDKAKLAESKSQVWFWCGRVRDLAPNDKLAIKVRDRMQTIADQPLDKALALTRSMVGNLKMRVVTLEDPY